MPEQNMHIAVAGNIGAGKTTLTEMLAKHYGWHPEFESVEDNPYLADFYEDMAKWSFHLQVYFLNSRFEQINNLRAGERTIIQDRTIYEDAYIFARSLHKQGYLGDRDYQNYTSLFESMIKFVAPPDLLIYLKADIGKLVSNIVLTSTIPTPDIGNDHQPLLALVSWGKVALHSIHLCGTLA